MKLLVVTQKIDRKDDNVGFFHRWVEEFARSADYVTVIANSVGEFSFPANVSVHSLGKESGARRISRWWKFIVLFSREYARADAVFFHMIPEFVVAASPFLVSLRRPSALWYVHKSVTPMLKLAERLVDHVVTASELSFRLPSKKVVYTGHAIDTEFFRPRGPSRHGSGINLLTVGRISPVKDIETILGACVILKDTWNVPWSFAIVGGPVAPRDIRYKDSLAAFVRSRGLERFVHFAGPVPYVDTPDVYGEHDIFLSMSTTGSIDKAVLEAMASGLTVITANEAFRDVLPGKYFLEMRSSEALAERIKSLANENRPNIPLRTIVEEHHSVQKTIREIIRLLV